MNRDVARVIKLYKQMYQLYLDTDMMNFSLDKGIQWRHTEMEVLAPLTEWDLNEHYETGSQGSLWFHSVEVGDVRFYAYTDAALPKPKPVEAAKQKPSVPKMKVVFTITSTFYEGRIILFTANPDKITLLTFGTVYRFQDGHYRLHVDKKFDFEEVLFYMEEYREWEPATTAS